jgi:hypothetical protein
MKTFIKDECPNLVDYMERMKSEFWPDWQENLRKPTPPKEKTRKSTKEEQVVATEQPAQENGNESKVGEPIVNGCSDKETTDGGKVSVEKIESTVELIKITPIAEEKEKTVEALENGVNGEMKTPNGGNTVAEVAVAQ